MRDGMGLELLAEEGVGIMVMTSEKSQLVEKRMKKLSLELFQGVKDKYARLQDILTQRSIKRSEVCYIGDDVNDLANLCASGWGICPQNAINEVKTQSDLVLSNQSGVLAIREAVDFITNYNKRFTNE
jgi:N-acylneuraminate cytidylyltransferase